MSSRSITNFSDFADRFVAQFSAKRAEKVTTSLLFETRQRPGESIEQFLYRFTELTLQATDVIQVTIAEAFQNGLRPCPFNDDLTIRKSLTLEDVRTRAIPYIAQEENTMMKESREKRENGRKSPSRKKSPPPKAEFKIKSTIHTRPEKQVH